MRILFITFFIFFYSFSMSLKAEIIVDIEIKNNDRISKQTIITYGKIELNKDYSQEDLNLILKNLYETNFFSNISLSLRIKNLSSFLNTVNKKQLV